MRTTILTIDHRINHSSSRCATLILFILMCVTAVPAAQAVSPAPGGALPGGNTAEGQNALLSLSTGTFNTAVGFLSLTKDSGGQFNTAIGAAALSANVGDPNSGQGVANTATGAGALLNNTTGFANTANGAFALFHNIDGSNNIAVGNSALFENVHGASNTAVGDIALFNNDVTGEGSANRNTAVGMAALTANTHGNSNTAVGVESLTSNISGVFNVAVGVDALERNTDGSANTAIGISALSSNVHGSFNTVIGDAAGAAVEGNHNIYIGTTAANGVTSESATIRIGNPQFVSNCFIAGIFGPVSGPGIPVVIDQNGKLGISMSSSRFKENINPMDDASEAIFSLKPVTFRYKKELDPEGAPQFGLIAEDVEKVNRNLVVHNKEGTTYSVRYDQVNAMLLNEFLKEHSHVREQDAIIAHQQNQIDALTAELHQVNIQLQLRKTAPQTVLNN
jgi:hypothetical protein